LRRNDREIADRREILAMLGKCDVLRLGINTSGYPYIVPLSFGFDDDGQGLRLWFHCAKEGRKLDLIEKDCHVGFEADCSLKLITGEAACKFTMEYESVIGSGNIAICHGTEEKRAGLKAIMRHYAPEKDFSFTEQELAAVCVLRLDVLQITGKRLKRE